MTDKINRGVQAHALLENELFKEVLNTLDGVYTKAWREAKTPEAREDCHRYVKLCEKIIIDIQSVANTGVIEQARQQELQRGKKGFPWPIAI